LAEGCSVRVVPEGRLNRLEIRRDGVLLGEYERSNDAEVDRKIGEIASARSSTVDAKPLRGVRTRATGSGRRSPPGRVPG
jgi:hypothetical protein